MRKEHCYIVIFTISFTPGYVKEKTYKVIKYGYLYKVMK